MWYPCLLPVHVLLEAGNARGSLGLTANWTRASYVLKSLLGILLKDSESEDVVGPGSAFFANIWVMPVRLVHGPHFELRGVRPFPVVGCAWPPPMELRQALLTVWTLA